MHGQSMGMLALWGLALVAGSADAAEEPAPDADSGCLLEFRSRLDNQGQLPAWMLAWNGSACSPPSWQGVSCLGGRVVALSLSDLQLSGPLPDLAMLQHLHNFSAAHNQLTGTLPTAWANLSNLTFLDLDSNRLTGTLPPSWASLAGLQSLDVAFNRLTGPLPLSWGSLRSLKECILHHNDLTGALPSQWSNLSNLTVLYVQDNRLSGSLPPEWASFQKLTNLTLHHNFLEGAQRLRLHWTLPSEWASLRSLLSLDLLSNNVTGALPHGPLPSSWSSLRSIRKINFESNSLTGTLPVSWGNLSSLEMLHLDDNQLEGPLRAEWEGMQALSLLRLEYNALTGTLPASWSRMQNLNDVHLGHNRLNGTLPAAWSTMPSLGNLTLDTNKLSGPLPEPWSSSPGLFSLSAKNNDLTGTLPSSWVLLRNLTELLVDSNKLTGSLPPSWSSFRTLSELDLSSNNLTGTIPRAWSNLQSLQLLSLSETKLTGPLPQNWQSAKHGPTYLTVAVEPMQDGYGLCGSVPANVQVVNANYEPISGQLPAGACPGPKIRGLDPIVVALPIVGGILVLLAAGFGALIWKGRQQRREQSRAASTKSIRPFVMLDVESAQASANGESAHSSTETAQLHPVVLELDAHGQPIVLGRGSCGKVYKARWNGLLVAIKALANTAQEMESTLQREAAILQALRHPHIVKYLGLFRDSDDRPLLVTEYMQGGDLAAALMDDKGTERQLGWYNKGGGIAAGVASGLAYLHANKVISFDVKPGNILLDITQTIAKLSDMGLAKLQTQSLNTLMGTLDYMAPELLTSLECESHSDEPLGLQSRRPITTAVDVYSFGLVLWQIITGESLDRAAGGLRQPRVPEECPESVWTLCQACLEEDPTQRPSSADIAKEIAAAIAGHRPCC